MCLAIPYEVLEVVDAETVRVRVGSGIQPCFTGLVDRVQVGDWVVIHAGLAIQKITSLEASQNLALIAAYLKEEPGGTL